MSPSAQAVPSNAQRGCVSATAIIWGCSTGMIAIDLLLSTSAQSETAIAMAIVAAAAVSTMTVWLSARKPASPKVEESAQAKA
ncbi:MAG: hypothetical protein KME42_22790 [Tildeniella nuda ZEHNDER 1965/U140]|nr:hypothetical protein [Tildeniella nuda ZEHNDER 1965/U140]